MTGTSPTTSAAVTTGGGGQVNSSDPVARTTRLGASLSGDGEPQASKSHGTGTAGSLTELVEAAKTGKPRALARLISLIEDRSQLLPEVMRLLLPCSGTAQIVGITGSPGVGKSTVTSAIVTRLRQMGHRVGVLAIDPSSPYSGGALLGDRIRMSEHATDPGVFIRSMASRGHLGGLAWATPQAVRALETAGCDVVLIETVGVGQSEVEVVEVADTVLVLVAPGMGDGIQAAKAGILEIGDIFVVNKADRDGAPAASRELRQMVNLADRTPEAWVPPVSQTIASTGKGIDELIEQIQAHWDWSQRTGALARRRQERASAEIEAIVASRLRERIQGLRGDSRLEHLAERVRTRQLDPYSAADQILAEIGAG